MLAYGYGFRLWLDVKVLADGALIQDYLVDTAREYGVDRHIRYGMKVTIASWSPSRQRWIVTTCAEGDGKTINLTCAHLVMCTVTTTTMPATCQNYGRGVPCMLKSGGLRATGRAHIGECADDGRLTAAIN
ncbi:FAD dependent oxidoreductase [Caballeronia arvi]|uniref:FAD dependent oxidoreductase n=1 Tax=Caballeronia arvi TaxID=1777135 RepID=A0A158L5W2_9BURK|nr:hypothetical protein [Caballeronia arvi]SAL88270.1 FAD dependent oxidoreductase [Caballeronia arvi]